MSQEGNEQKLPFATSMDKWWNRRAAGAQAIEGKSFPCIIESVDTTGTIVTVSFLVTDDILQFPQATCPVACDIYSRPPLQKGDKGYCLPADVYLGGVSGLGGGI